MNILPKRKFIVHVDMDAFFAAIEQRDNPSLRGKPVIVGADPKKGRGRGVVSTCSYEARKFGVHSGLPISIAYKKCPHAIFLPVNMEKYARISRQIYKIFYDFTPEVEPISIDEAFMDITGSFHLFGTPRSKSGAEAFSSALDLKRGTPRETCLLIKSRVKKDTGLTASVGLAPVKMVAKIASDLEKPDGFVEVSVRGLLGFLWPLDIRKLWGLGRKTEIILRKMNVNTIGELAKKDVKELIDVFGKNGAHLWNLANGIDERTVEFAEEAKSIGNEITFDKDTLSREKIESTLMLLCEKVSGRLRCDGLKGRTITLKIRLEGFKTYTRAITIGVPNNFTDMLYKEVKNLYNRFNSKGKKVRLVGVKVSNLSPADFRDTLFIETGDKKRENVHSAVDKIKEKFGTDSIHRGSNPTIGKRG
ncbi:MAG: DNA polymerase IV [Candidatus Omnitrophica bacterium]|nr:DNA polymerase IV [Candidatus Omnitrophota bacterium]